MSTKRIVFVSRLDSDCSLGAFLLCEIAPRLVKIYDDIEIYIVGGGQEYKKISKKAEKINTSFNRRFIFTVGYSNQPSSFFTKDTLFVGVSRSAIEAMACGLPVILLGNEGYLGLLNKDSLQKAIKTNLTCRSSKMSISADSLFREICSFFEMSQDEKKILSDFSRSVAKKYYSVEECAKQTVEFYQEIIKSYQSKQNKGEKHKKIAICGYYGRANFGDEAILCEILGKIRKASKDEVEISLIKSNSIHKIIPALTGTDLFIFGGGSLLQNSTSNKSLMFYIAVIFLANILCKRKIMLSNGIGPIEGNEIFKYPLVKSLQHALQTFDFLSVRDTSSQKFVEELIQKKKIHLINDPATVYFINSKSKTNCELICSANKDIVSSQNFIEGDREGNIVYIPSEQALAREKIDPYTVGNSLKYLAEHLESRVTIAILSNEDKAIARKIAQRARNCQIIAISSRNQLISILKRAKICITQRYHGALYSLYCKVPTLAISNDPKMKALCSELGTLPSIPTNVIRANSPLVYYAKQALLLNKQKRESISAQIYCQGRETDEKLKKIFSHYI